MWSMVYSSVGHPSVCPRMDPQQQTRWRCSSLLLWARQTGDIDRLLHGARQHGMRGANAGSATLPTHVESSTQTWSACFVCLSAEFADYSLLESLVSTAKISYSSFRDNISSGVNFLRRRFSSSDLQDDLTGSSSAAPGGYGHPGPPSQRRGPPVASSFGAGVGQVAAAAAAGLGSLVGGGQTDHQRTSPNRDRCKVLLVIDEPHVDWSVLADNISNFHNPRWRTAAILKKTLKCDIFATV